MQVRGELKKKTITFWHPYGDKVNTAAVEKIATGFMKDHPDVIVKTEFIGGTGSGSGITDKLSAAISGGIAPDVVIFDRFQVGQWADQGLFEDITADVKAAGVTPDQFYKFSWDESSYKGKQYGLPFDTDARALFYNKDMFKESGLDPENPPKTIAELDKAAEKLTVKQGNGYKTLGFYPWDGQGWLYTWGWAFGGNFTDASGKVTANDPKIIEALKWETSYAKKYGIENITSFATAGGADISPFAAKKIGMTISGPWELAGLKTNAPDLNYGVSLIPSPDGAGVGSWAGGFALVVPKGAKDKKDAVDFIKYACTGDGAKVFGEDTTHFMSFQSINAGLGWVKSEPRAKIFIDALPNSHNRPVLSKGQLLWDELATATDNAFHGKGDPKKLLDDVTSKVNKELGK